MAEAFLSVILKNLNSLVQDGIGLILGVDKEMSKLASILTTIQAVMEDAEQQQLESQAIRNWLIKLSDLTYEIDDTLDECATHVSKWKFYKNTRSGPHSLQKLLFRHKIGRRIKEVTEKLDAVAAEREKFHLREMNFERPSKMLVAARETGSLLNDTDHVYGREAEKEKIVDILVNQAKGNQEISILPIIGVGGLGKTTLAQLVYKDPSVVDHFEKKIWVCVSNDFDVKTLIKNMIESATGSSCASDLVQLEALERHLWDLLNHKRYLLVLDDVWNDDQEKWFKLKNVLTCGSAGSSIIITTRQRKVAEIMATLPAQNLDVLSEEHCWLLLRQRAFAQGEDEQFPDLTAIGKQIVKKCAGVPLAAKALGGLLRFRRTEAEWIHVKESELWNLPQDETSILSALRLSYLHLPLALKQCFVYCAIFPKDYEISKPKLIFHWIAHGYISSNGTLAVEDVAEQILNELVLRSLLQHHIQDVGEQSFHSVTMHDLVHDLAESIMENKVPGERVERISMSNSNRKIREASLYKHYVAFPRSMQLEMDISFVLKKYPCLRVLDAQKSEIKELSSKLGNLKHLRYLNLSGQRFRTLPKSLCNLWNLEILILKHCGELIKFPKNMNNLKNLRNLFLDGCWGLREPPYRIGELTSLRTLDLFIVGCNKGNQLEELQGLSLGGQLHIFHLERVENPIDAKKANLADKHNLRQLALEWEVNAGSKLRGHVDEKVLEALQPHPNINNFRIFGFNGRHLPNWMKILTLAKLVSVQIADCQNLLDLFQLEELPYLSRLILRDLAAVEYIVQGRNPLNIKFPSLEELELRSLPNLKGFVKEEAGGICPKLQKLTVWDCGGSLFFTSFPKLHNLKSLRAQIGEDMTCIIPHETLECFSNLEVLYIEGAHDHCLPIKGLQGLHFLRELEIQGSKTLTCLPGEWLSGNTTLQVLCIRSFLGSPIHVLPKEIGCLVTLRRITLDGLCKMVCIPEAIRHLSSLECLDLVNLDKLTSLPDWLGDLTALNSLRISSCAILGPLPSCIQRMTNLQSLEVSYCPNLTMRYEEGKGEDWHKIAHIPRLRIYHRVYEWPSFGDDNGRKSQPTWTEITAVKRPNIW